MLLATDYKVETLAKVKYSRSINDNQNNDAYVHEERVTRLNLGSSTLRGILLESLTTYIIIKHTIRLTFVKPFLS